VQFIHINHPQDGKVHWVNDENENTIAKRVSLKWLLQQMLPHKKTILTGTKHVKYM
jgi:hypothetical protein